MIGSFDAAGGDMSTQRRRANTVYIMGVEQIEKSVSSEKIVKLVNHERKSNYHSLITDSNRST